MYILYTHLTLLPVLLQHFLVAVKKTWFISYHLLNVLHLNNGVQRQVKFKILYMFQYVSYVVNLFASQTNKINNIKFNLFTKQDFVSQ